MSTVPVLFLVANWGSYGYGCCGCPVSKLRRKPWLPRFFRGALTQLPIRILREPGVEVTDETGKLPPHISAVFNFCSAPPFVLPLRSLRGRCRLRQMRCNYIRAVGATLLQYVSVSSAPKSIAVGNGFIRSVVIVSPAPTGRADAKNRIGISVDALLKKRIYPFRFVASTDAVNTTVCSRGFDIVFPLRSLRGRCRLRQMRCK